MPALDAERAPLLPPVAADAAHRGAREAEAPAEDMMTPVEAAAEMLLAGASRAARELRDCFGLLFIAMALAVAAVVAPARVVRAATARSGFDGTAPLTPATERDVPLPAGHARGVALWVDAANGVRIHARVFLPAHAAASKEPELRNAVSSTFLEAVRLAARMGDAVLLLPPTGGAVETWIWSGTVAALTAARKTVICLDFRGQGSSSAPAGRYSLPMLAADAAAMVQRACGGAGPVHVIGWSLGGGAGLQLALDRPELVRSLCVFGFTASFCGGESSSAARAAKAVVASPRLVAALGVAGHGMLLALMLRFRAGGPPDRAAARRAIHAANSLVGYMGTVGAWQPFDVTQRLSAGSLRCPLLHLHTAADGHFGGHTAAKKARDCALVVAGGGRASMRTQAGPWSHGWPLEDPASWNAQLLAWLQ